MSSRPAQVEEPESWSGDGIARLAVDCLGREVDAWPKPGLVSRIDRGSHADMDASTFRRSADALRPHLAALAEAGRAGAGMARLRAIGLAAEADMLAATGGVNTHRGAVFGLGLLCAAAGRLAPHRRGGATGGPSGSARTEPRRHGTAEVGDDRRGASAIRHPPLSRVDTVAREPEGRFATLGTTVATLWGDAILAGPVPLGTHGAEARRMHGAGGARAEAAAGFPTLYGVGLPALRDGRRLAPDDPEAARVHCCFALIAALEDTNLLHRGGPDGLAFARREAQAFVDRGGVGASGWREDASLVHRAFVARGLSPGGAADLLAMTLFADVWDAP